MKKGETTKLNILQQAAAVLNQKVFQQFFHNSPILGGCPLLNTAMRVMIPFLN